MTYFKEPSDLHGYSSKIAVVLVNLGTPDAPTPAAVRRYLKEFLSDQRVVELPKIFWWPILRGLVLPFRATKSARKYAAIWTHDGSPLKGNTERQVERLNVLLKERGHQVEVILAMRYGSQNLSEVLQKLKESQFTRILLVPAYPQYSAASTGSVYDAVFAFYKKIRNLPELRFVRDYHDNEGYIHALADTVYEYWRAHGQGKKLVMSFHGLPKRSLDVGDPYYYECQTSARLLAEYLHFSEKDYFVSFQSRFGLEKWLQPYTIDVLNQLAKEGHERVDVICPGFIVDCLETLEEIVLMGRAAFLGAGGKEFHYIPCLNQTPYWMKALADVVEQHLLGWPTMLGIFEKSQQAKHFNLSRQHALGVGLVE